MRKEPNIKVSQTKDELHEQFAQWLIEESAEKSVINIALAGGDAPMELYDWLSLKHKQTIPWNKFNFYFGDERCVPPADADSNYKMAMQHLLEPLGISADHIFRIRGEDDPDQEATRYGELLASSLPLVDELPQFDIVLLGMAEDGHTASIFVDQIELIMAPEICVASIHTETGQKRVTLSGSVIDNASHVAFIVTGSEKSEKVKEILHRQGDFQKYPAFHITAAEGELTWYLDIAAAALL